ncbi:dihydrodipicolinate synthase family protein [Agrilactobacillus yilanensis]|uniref:Dihydrodipicolinate synthase family protein n=1 Tax=Agrilactobacillus yilanensis TaxID=2485997 RepID=A0ABW4J5T5_9LACO|nr:dihydrodipicolinate synthase family protein [Agrilactobacillus yilanensis]
MVEHIQYLTPLVTPFDRNGQLDLDALDNIVNRQIEAGIDGFVVMGSAGEFWSLSMDERKQMIDYAFSVIQQQCRVMIGTGADSTQDALTLSKYAVKRGARELIVITPYYLSMNQEEIYDYYAQVATAADAKIYLYNFPDRTGNDIEPETVLRLKAHHNNICGFKDTVSDMAHTRRLLQTILPKYPDFEIYAGFDENVVRNVLSGGAGGIGALANVVPELASDLMRAFKAHDLALVARYQQQLDRLMGLFEIMPGFPSTIKTAMAAKGCAVEPISRSGLPLDSKQKSRMLELLFQ